MHMRVLCCTNLLLGVSVALQKASCLQLVYAVQLVGTVPSCPSITSSDCMIPLCQTPEYGVPQRTGQADQLVNAPSVVA